LFDGKVHKLTSILASLTTAQFQLALAVSFERDDAERLARMAPHFDARVLQLPSKTEAANMFLWRAMDARKNSVSMAAQAHFPRNALHRRDQRHMRTMLAEKGIDFEAAYPAGFKRGTWVRRITIERAFAPEELARIPEQHRPQPGTLVRRSDVDEIAMPQFHTVTNRVEVIFDGADPCVDQQMSLGCIS
jgi:tRNA(His) 5'-end guanylyltransferase